MSINDYSSKGGAELLEGIGTGFVWDQYGHGGLAVALRSLWMSSRGQELFFLLHGFRSNHIVRSKWI